MAEKKYEADRTISKFKPNKRLKKLIDYRDWLAENHKRDIFCDNEEFLIFHWSGKAETFAAATGEQAANESERINFGDNSQRVDVGGAFPYASSMPSKVEGYEPNVTNWAKDYVYFLDHSPAEVHPYEKIVGEFHWQLDEARFYKYPEKHKELGLIARRLGAGGFGLAHTCPDLGIGLKLGWDGLLAKVRESKAKHKTFKNEESVAYLSASEQIVLSVQRFIELHASNASKFALEEEDEEKKQCYLDVAASCSKIAHKAPTTLYEALQWIMLYMVVERINGHGNGYGRFDILLNPFYQSDLKKRIITPQEARNLMAEWYLKYGPYISFGGKTQDGEDATNEFSWIGMQAYDMVGGFNQIGVLWHKKIDPDFYLYCCDVVGRHGCGVPALLNSDVMVASELRTGFDERYSKNVSYSGCQWYCIPGREYQEQDCNCIVLVMPMQRAMNLAIEKNITTWEDFWKIYCCEVDKTAEAFANFKNEQYKYQAKLWPEMITSLMSYGPIEKGRDITDFDSVDYNYPSCNILGTPNVADSMYAIKRVIFDEKKFTMKDLQIAIDRDWTGDGEEKMRQYMLNLPKYGNDIDEVDAMAVKVAEQIRSTVESKRCNKGGHFRISLFQYQGHTVAGPYLGATPDGRKKAEPLAHGMNPMHGRNKNGIIDTANSFCKLDFAKYQGGSLQIELHPSFFPDDQPRGQFVKGFSDYFFEKGGVQINLNVLDINVLKEAMRSKDKESYKDIVVKVTGYCAHFIFMDKKFQKEFVERVNYESL